MSYYIALCNKNSLQVKQLTEMLHIYENEYNTNFIIHTYKDLSSFLPSSYNLQYDIIFLNMLQGGQPNDLFFVYDLHKQYPAAALFSINPTHDYEYYHDLANEAAFMRPPFSYHHFKKNLYIILKNINLKRLGSNWSDKYIKIQTRYKEEYIERERIEYIITTKHNTTIHTLERDYVVFTDSEIKMLPLQFSNTFFHANKYCIFNIKYLYNLEKVKRITLPFHIKLFQYYIVTPSYFFIPIEKKLYHYLFPQFIKQTLTNEKIHLSPY